MPSNPTLVLDPKLINMLVAYEILKNPPVRKLKPIQIASLLGVISDANEKIAERIFQLWRHQYPRALYVLPALRPKEYFE